ncbi:UPF0329 protein ECU05_1680/ECU11_0050-like [Chenopodium quinoa]|uniref:UPF0329 protein ECU05_1680/ECU11_0050-like n=1 Tax=Chenopodium quinoa TaxID=63459 RepID=UPI000B76C7B8|nr:UPF0329 protein ECU05_1680/ECU11_0050-like [Chenopodium quinoa]
MSSSLDDDDTWWFCTYMDHEQPMECAKTSTKVEEDETLSLFRVHEQEQPVVESATTPSTNEEEKIKSSFRVLEEKEEKIGEVKNTEEEEEDDLDATWKAIMESKGLGTRPQLRKSDTWSCGDGGGKEREKGKGEMGGLSKYRVRRKLKKWQSFREMVERKVNVGGDSGGGDGGEKSGQRSMDVALTFHDEFKKRADAFIARFTHDIRLQRLESDQRFLEMINRGL